MDATALSLCMDNDLPICVFDLLGHNISRLLSGEHVGTVVSSQNAIGHWFGEGDDLFYIDGEKIPSIIGTGTEAIVEGANRIRQGLAERMLCGGSEGASQYSWAGFDEPADLAQARAAMERALLRIRVAERRHREGPRQRR